MDEASNSLARSKASCRLSEGFNIASRRNSYVSDPTKWRISSESPRFRCLLACSKRLINVSAASFSPIFICTNTWCRYCFLCGGQNLSCIALKIVSKDVFWSSGDLCTMFVLEASGNRPHVLLPLFQSFRNTPHIL